MPEEEESILQSIIKSQKVMSHMGKKNKIIIQTAIPNQNQPLLLLLLYSMLLQEIKY